jgi:hypothetical protein
VANSVSHPVDRFLAVAAIARTTREETAIDAAWAAWLAMTDGDRLAHASEIADLISRERCVELLASVSVAGSQPWEFRWAVSSALGKVPRGRLLDVLEAATRRGAGSRFALALASTGRALPRSVATLAIHLAMEIADPGDRARTLAEFRPWLGPRARAEVFGIALRAAQSSSGGYELGEVIGALARGASEPEADVLWSLANQLDVDEDEDELRSALEGFVEHLRGPRQLEASAWLERLPPQQAAGGSDDPFAYQEQETTLDMLASLAQVDRAQVLREAIGAPEEPAAPDLTARRVAGRGRSGIELPPLQRTDVSYEDTRRFYGPPSERWWEIAEGPTHPSASWAGPTPASRNVSVGVSAPDQPVIPLRADRPLKPQTPYLIWFEVGDVAGSIEEAAAALPPLDLEREPCLTVTLFGAGQPTENDTNTGRLRWSTRGWRVEETPLGASPSQNDGENARLFFPIWTMRRSGWLRMRLNVYHAGVLLQSRLLRLRVSRRALMGRMLRATADYTISATLEPSSVAVSEPHSLSILVNRSESGTHQFYVAAGDDHGSVRREVTFDAYEIKALLEEVRQALRTASWGTKDEWEGQPYRYGDQPGLDRLGADLVRMANRGWILYDAIEQRLGGHEMLRTLLRRPTLIQIALTESPRLVLPTAMLYDHPFDSGLPELAAYRICPEFIAALGVSQPLAQCRCFAGDCPSYGEDDVVCPSGFWGFRHELGMPVSCAPAKAAESISYVGSIDVAIARSTDPAIGWELHELGLARLIPPAAFRYAADRSDTFKMLKDQEPHLVYFYCHGGSENGRPYLSVGEGNGLIFADSLLAKGIQWPLNRPLVFLNGCRTAAVSPEMAHGLVAAFVSKALAGAVIGTEVTVFEGLARAFAEGFLMRFINGMSLGAATRETRLELLKERNPLGLAYIPYGLSTLRVVATAS